ncbi:ExbD/TolR family protein [Oceaniglobus ichthyenteri]|uniref:ExbD/TolR family protein n=1 Tax=Oceaniglobus ichthyenteri TaxID=2136177 RepID=UPI000D35C8AA|nr:biopolymer transporter ExbD [Oceaniglobus ichthyenteri]
MFSFAAPRRRRRPSLTPMIDVVFLLLVFFMLASQFGRDTAVPLSAGGGRAPYSGPPRLIDIGATDLRLNGVVIDAETLAARLEQLTQDRDDLIILRADDDATLQRLIDVAHSVQQAGFTRLSVVE